jgi:hypothetical protein
VRLARFIALRLSAGRGQARNHAAVPFVQGKENLLPVYRFRFSVTLD